MKLIILFCLVFVFGWMGIIPKTPSGKAAIPKIAVTDTIDFTRQVQPILVKNCSPCHFTGGKMYEKMPFDKDTTIINHQSGILKRIKGEDNGVIKSFVNQKTKQ